MNWIQIFGVLFLLEKLLYCLNIYVDSTYEGDIYDGSSLNPFNNIFDSFQYLDYFSEENVTVYLMNVFEIDNKLIIKEKEQLFIKIM